MEITVIILIAVVALAAVAAPMLRRGDADARGDLDAPGEGRPRHASRAPRKAATDAVPEADDLAVVVDEPAPGPDLESEVRRYRDALRAGTICPSCRQANPPGSRFCYECGRALGPATPPDETDEHTGPT